MYLNLNLDKKSNAVYTRKSTFAKFGNKGDKKMVRFIDE